MPAGLPRHYLPEIPGLWPEGDGATRSSEPSPPTGPEAQIAVSLTVAAFAPQDSKLYHLEVTMWNKPEYTEMRFGFEVTMYIANR